MSTHKNESTSPTPTYPNAHPVGHHLLIDKTEWVPGPHPEPHRRSAGQRTYPESYFRCIKCGEERLSKRRFPDSCDGDPVSSR
jgi:hypothetical protein